jgi:hypothetical protein
VCSFLSLYFNLTTFLLYKNNKISFFEADVKVILLTTDALAKSRTSKAINYKRIKTKKGKKGANPTDCQKGRVTHSRTVRTN